MSEISMNRTQTEREHLVTQWMSETLTDEMHHYHFRDYLIEHLPSPLPRWVKGSTPQWDWSESKVSEEEFEKFHDTIKDLISDEIQRIENRNARLTRKIIKELREMKQ